MDSNISNKSNSKIDFKKLTIGILCAVIYIVLSNLPAPKGLTPEGLKALSLMVVAVIAWVFEVIPIGISATLFVMIMSDLGITSMNEAMGNFMIPTVLFIMSTFIIAAVFIDTGLSNRVALYVSTLFGNKADMVLLSFMLPTSLVSIVLLDIPTAIIFSSIAYPLLKRNNCLPGKSNFGKSLMIGIPMAAACGIGTPAGSGMNILAISLLKTHANVDINFLQWSMIGIPLAIILVFAEWFIIKTLLPSEIEYIEGLDDVKSELKKLGKLTKQEKKFLVIFFIELALWITQPWNNINTAVVAIIASSLFFFPGIDLCKWERANEMINWGMLFLVGASNSLAVAISSTGGSEWLASTFLGGLTGANLPVLLLAVTAFGVFAHIIIPVGSAVLAVAIPVVAALAGQMGINPAVLVLPIAFTSACVFIMPLDPIPLTTYNYGYWKMWDMIKVGFFVSLAWIAAIVASVFVAQVIGII